MNGGRAVLVMFVMIGICVAGAETPDPFWPWVNLFGVGLVGISLVLWRAFS